MAGLVPAMKQRAGKGHAPVCLCLCNILKKLNFLSWEESSGADDVRKGVDGRDKPGHDGWSDAGNLHGFASSFGPHATLRKGLDRARRRHQTAAILIAAKRRIFKAVPLSTEGHF